MLKLNQNLSNVKYEGQRNLKQSAQKKGKNKYQGPQSSNAANYLTLDIVQNMAYECSIDQKCSMFIQDWLRQNIDKNERERFYDKLLKNPSIDFDFLVYDQNGNYIVQRILTTTTADQEYHQLVYQKLKGKILNYATHKFACRVIQTCFHVFSQELCGEILKEVNNNRSIIQIGNDFNGNHVIQKVIIEMSKYEDDSTYKEFIN